jgi:hypothetical protein
MSRGAVRIGRRVTRSQLRELGAVEGDQFPIRNYDTLAAKSAMERIERLSGR